jgi:hypothetical protein
MIAHGAPCRFVPTADDRWMVYAAFEAARACAGIICTTSEAPLAAGGDASIKSDQRGRIQCPDSAREAAPSILCGAEWQIGSLYVR